MKSKRVICDRRGKPVEQAAASCVLAYRRAQELLAGKTWMSSHYNLLERALMPCYDCPVGRKLSRRDKTPYRPVKAKPRRWRMQMIIYNILLLLPCPYPRPPCPRCLDTGTLLSMYDGHWYLYPCPRCGRS